MEKIVMMTGFGIMYLCFLCMICIGSQFLAGVLVGMAITAFGYYFFDE